jgi:spore germination cell wall hydrolase CwlJ-like protein
MNRGAGTLAVAGVWLVVGMSTAVALPVRPVENAQLECLALNVYFEARSESFAGQLAVAHTTLNRVADARFPSTICGVVRDGGEARRGKCQFSWWCDGKSDRVRERDAWESSLAVAHRALRNRVGDPTDGALYFHHVAVRPTWARHRELTARIGKHLFYR